MCRGSSTNASASLNEHDNTNKYKTEHATYTGELGAKLIGKETKGGERTEDQRANEKN